jgi:hypothetical protein
MVLKRSTLTGNWRCRRTEVQCWLLGARSGSAVATIWMTTDENDEDMMRICQHTASFEMVRRVVSRRSSSLPTGV